MSLVVAAAEKVQGPEIDWMAISPLIALVGGACLVLMAGLLRAPFVRQTLVPFLALVALGAAAGLDDRTWGDNVSVIADAMVMDDLTLFLTLLFVAAARRRACCCPGAGSRRARRATASSTRCCSPSCSA